MSGVVVLLLLVALSQAIRGAWPRAVAPLDRLIAFTVTPPPPPPPVLDRSQLVPRRAAASAPQLGGRWAPAGPEREPYAAAPLALAPITASPLNDVTLSLGSDLHQLEGNDDPGGGGGGDNGKGSAGDGDGSTRTVKLARADWIRPPSRRDLEREVRRSGLKIAASVDVVLLCEVRENGHPFDCVVARESLPGKKFGAAAIRVVQGSLIRPMTIDDKRVDVRVVVPVTFIGAKEVGTPPHPQSNPGD